MARCIASAVAAALACMVSPATALGATYYLSVTGRDDPDGGLSLAEAFRTFPFATSRLNPGDTLSVDDGVWTRADGGLLDLDCMGGTQRSGTDAGAITVQALRSRRVVLDGDAVTDTLRVSQCSHWVIDGLTVVTARDAGSTRSSLVVSASFDVVLRSLLVSGSTGSGSNILLTNGPARITFEDNEVYDWDSTPGFNAYCSGCIFRRNYLNNHGLPGDCIGLHGSRNLVENNVTENCASGYSVYAFGNLGENRFYANVSLLDFYGASHNMADSTIRMVDNVWENFAVVSPRAYGVFFRGAEGSRCDHCSVLHGRGDGLRADVPSFGDGGRPSLVTVYSDDTLMAFNDAGTGYEILNVDGYAVRNGNSYGNDTLYTPVGGSGFVGMRSIDPQLGGCLVFIPPGSPMKGAGLDGGDIGANVLYRVVNGQPTREPLWDPMTGAFPCGAVVPGINDVPDASCRDVHVRLHVNANGCQFPPDYQASADAGPHGGGDGGGADGGNGPVRLAIGCGCTEQGHVALLAALAVAARRRRAVAR